MEANIKELAGSRDRVNQWMERFGVRFGIYKNGEFREQLFPFDPVPRIISKTDWDYLERGLQQRVQGYLPREAYRTRLCGARRVCLFVQGLCP